MAVILPPPSDVAKIPSLWTEPEPVKDLELAGRDCETCSQPLVVAPGRGGWLCPSCHAWQLPSAVERRTTAMEPLHRKTRATVLSEEERLQREIATEIDVLRRQEELSDLRRFFLADSVPADMREAAREQARRLQVISRKLEAETTTALRAAMDISAEEIRACQAAVTVINAEARNHAPVKAQAVPEDIYEAEWEEIPSSYLPCQLCQEDRQRIGQIPSAECRAEILAPGPWQFRALDLCRGHYLTLLSEIVRNGFGQEFVRVIENYSGRPESSEPQMFYEAPLAIEAPEPTAAQSVPVIREKTLLELTGEILGSILTSGMVNSDRV